MPECEMRSTYLDVGIFSPQVNRDFPDLLITPKKQPPTVVAPAWAPPGSRDEVTLGILRSRIGPYQDLLASRDTRLISDPTLVWGKFRWPAYRVEIPQQLRLSGMVERDPHESHLAGGLELACKQHSIGIDALHVIPIDAFSQHFGRSTGGADAEQLGAS